MADLSYALQQLNDLGRQLNGLADAMNGTAARTRWDPEEIGHPSVSDALDDFAGAWDDKRDRLTHSLHSVADMATQSASTFQGVDDQLAAKVEQILAPQ